MAALLIAIVPFVVTGITSVIKRFPLISQLENRGTYTWTVRCLAFILSLVAVSISYMQTGVIEEGAINTIVMAFVSTLSSIGIHEVGSKK